MRPASFIPATPTPSTATGTLPEKTREAFRGDYCTVGDLARRDEDGYIYLVDRKSNMIISGGENIYPSEVEALLGAHPQVKDVAVIGVADEKWGERVHAVIVRTRARPRPRTKFWTGARPGSPATSARVRSRSSVMTKCREPQPARSCIASCACSVVPERRGRGVELLEREGIDDPGLECRRTVLRGLDRSISEDAGHRPHFRPAGRHIQPIWDHVARQGIRIIDVRMRAQPCIWRTPMPS